MGMGIAVKFRDLFGQVDALKRQNVRNLWEIIEITLILNQQVKTGGCAVLKAKDRFVYYLVTKDRTGGGCYPTYASLESSLKAMREHMIKNEVKEIAVRKI